ncbi:helix-turn-helix transcriptional regulator [Actinocorallia longicatena]
MNRHPRSRVPLAHRERVDWHHHADHQLIYPRRGVLRVSTAEAVWAVPPQRAVWLPALVPHAHEAHGPTDLRCVIFAENPLALRRPTVMAVSPLLAEVVAALTAEDAPGPERRRNLQRVALDELRPVEGLTVRLPTPADARLRDVAALLEADPATPRTLAELGAEVGASERTLSRLFRAETGMSFPQWRTQLRLHHSLTLLARGSSVTAVAADCGYNGPSAFIHAFRTAFGTTPGAHLVND